MPFSGFISHLFHPKKSNNQRAKLLHAEAYVFFILAILGFYLAFRSLSLFGFSSGWVLGFSSTINPSEVISQTNEQRRSLGLSELTLNQQLSNAALAKAQDMFNNQYWAHTSPTGVKPWNFIRNAGYSYRVAGENLARDFYNTSDMVSAWMASPTHRDNIVNPKYQEIGVAVVDGELLGYETTLVVQMFGTQLSTTPQVSGEEDSGQVAVAEEPAPVDEVASNPEITLTNHELSEEEITNLENGIEEPIVELAEAEIEEESTIVKSPARLQMENFSRPPLFSPLQLVKAFFLAMILMIIVTLSYDLFIVSNSNIVRLVGKNMAHMMLLISVSFILLFFKGGMIQ